MKRFQKMTWGIAFFLCLSLISGCAGASSNENDNAKTFTKYLDVLSLNGGDFVLPLNTTVKLTMTDEKTLDQAVLLLETELPFWHQLADSHRGYVDADGHEVHNLYYINQHPDEVIPVQPELAAMLDQALTLTELSEGYFNPFLGALSGLWETKFAPFPTENIDPDAASLDEIVGCLPQAQDVRKTLEIDTGASTLIFRPDAACTDRVLLNLGAMAKGYILDQLAEQLKVYSTPFLLDAGSSSLIAWSPYGQPKEWSIGVRSPLDSQTVLFAFSAYSGAVSTSGDDQHYFLLKQPDGTTVRRHHILNPFTGVSENYLRCVTLYGTGNAGVLDVLSTVLYNIEDEEQRLAVIRKFSAFYALDIDFGWVEETQEFLEISVSAGMRQRLIAEPQAPAQLSILRGEEND